MRTSKLLQVLYSAHAFSGCIAYECTRVCVYVCEYVCGTATAPVAKIELYIDS
jgi:hypothetical protein